jgi:hypothetical protein
MEGEKTSTSKSSFWNKETRRPTKFTILLLILLTLIFLIWGIVDIIASTHRIRLEIDYSEDFSGYVRFYGTTEKFDSDKGNEFTYQIREGNDVRVKVRKLGGPYGSETLRLKLYDNGRLVREEYITDNYGSTNFEYTVGSYEIQK